jgi:prepilin-type N-terminal cleavage/methylation domain-containing protein
MATHTPQTLLPGVESPGRIQRGFTLIELLIVVGIIAILIAIVVTVGLTATSSNRERVTRDTINTLEAALAEYIAVKGSPPPATFEWTDRNGDRTTLIASDVRIADAGGSVADTSPALDSTGMFLAQGEKVPQVRSIIESIPSRWVKPGTLPGTLTVPQGRVFNTVVDGWDRPIRYVHPALNGWVYGPNYARPSSPDAAVTALDVFGPAPAGAPYAIASFRRNVRDADSGRGANNRPYFYSAGADGDPATIEDNVYVNRPTFVKQ